MNWAREEKLNAGVSKYAQGLLRSSELHRHSLKVKCYVNA